MKFVLLLLAGIISISNSQQLQRSIPNSFAIQKAPQLPFIGAKVINHGSREKRIIAFTFDACSTSAFSRYDSAIAGILIRSEIPATIFMSGIWVLHHQKEIQNLSKYPFIEIGNHSFLHPHCKKISEERLHEELELTQDILFTLTGKQPMLFRAPYGELNDTIVSVASKIGLQTIQYDLPSGDPDSNSTKEKLLEYVGSMTKNGSIIVMHINKRGWHTAEALPAIIEKLRKRGFTFVTVSKLLTLNH